MAKDKEIKKVDEVVAEAPKAEVVAKADPRLPLWREFVENYKKANPVKHASKEANGEFKNPPASFLGIKKELKLAKGGVKVLIY